jgi:hypothetical protein
MLPTFIVIGAMKCGTTSLYYYLREHSEVGMSDRKETDFFIKERNYDRGREWYEARFSEGRARGECSPNYTKAHLFPGVAQRMHNLVPDVRLVYMVRDPIDRIISHYVGSTVQGRETRPFCRAVTEGEQNNYVMTSRYGRQLKPYLDLFDDDQLLVCSLERLAEHPSDVLRDVHAFLGVETAVSEQQLQLGQFNATSRKRKRGAWYRWISNRVPQSVKDRLRPYVPRHWIPGTPVTRPDPSEALRRQLRDQLSEDIETLRQVTGRSFERWCV